MSSETDQMPAKLSAAELPAGAEAESVGDMFPILLMEDKAVLIAGLSLIGEGGHMVMSVGIYQGVDRQGDQFANIKGWTAMQNHPEERFNGLNWLDTKQPNDASMLAIPNTIIYFVAEVDASLLCPEEADSEELKAIVEFGMAQIHD